MCELTCACRNILRSIDKRTPDATTERHELKDTHELELELEPEHDYNDGHVLAPIVTTTTKEQQLRPWILCDMDAASRTGSPVGKKTSSAYAPPELMRIKQSGGEQLEHSAPSFDIWSLGVILFELCTGRTLFSQDISNDELLLSEDKLRLCTWHTITDEELSPVLQEADDASEETATAARNLIRWCLKGNPEERPTVLQIITHAFLSPGGKMPHLPMRYHGFLSHAQADASGTVSTLHLLYKQFGLHCWIDMQQDKLTLEGMRQGVRDSSVFILLLTERVLGSWFCQQEALCAIEEQKPIQLIVELEQRFHPFDVTAWTASMGDSQRMIKTAAGETTVPPAICRMIDENLPNAVTYRRRDFEQDSMMQELCRRSGLTLPTTANLKPMVVAADDPPLIVAVILSLIHI